MITTTDSQEAPTVRVRRATTRRMRRKANRIVWSNDVAGINMPKRLARAIRCDDQLTGPQPPTWAIEALRLVGWV